MKNVYIRLKKKRVIYKLEAGDNYIKVKKKERSTNWSMSSACWLAVAKREARRFLIFHMQCSDTDSMSSIQN